MGDTGEEPVNRVVSGGKKNKMKQRLFGMLKLAIGAGLFAGIAALTMWRLLG